MLAFSALYKELTFSYVNGAETWSSLCLHMLLSLQWRHNGLDGVSNHQPHHCLLSRLFGRRSKKTSKLRVTGLYAGNSPGTGEFPAQMASTAEYVSIWWRHHVYSGAIPSAETLTTAKSTLFFRAYFSFIDFEYIFAERTYSVIHYRNWGKLTAHSTPNVNKRL